MGAFTLSAGAAGAAQSLQDLLKQRMLERQMMLAEWQAQQEAEYRKQQLAETTKLREAQQEWQRTYQTELLGDKQQAAQDRQQAGHLRKIDLMPIGTTVGKTDPTLQEAETFGTRQLFQGQPVSEAGKVGQIGAGPMQSAGPDTLASQPITNEPEEQQFQFQGTAPQQQAAANAKALQEDRDANRALREQQLAALQAQREWLRDDQYAANLTPGGLDVAAHQYAQTMTMPPLGRGPAATKKSIELINRVAELYPNLKVATSGVVYSGIKAAYGAMKKQRTAIGAFEKTAQRNITIMTDVMKKLQDAGSPLINRPWRTVAQMAAGDERVAAFEAARRVVVNEIAKITTNPNMTGVLTDESMRHADNLLRGDYTLPQMNSAIAVLRRDMGNRLLTMDAELDALLGEAEAIGEVTPPSAGGSAIEWVRDPKTGKLVKKGG